MSGPDEDDKPTVVLDLNALKKEKLKQEEELANLASGLEFNVFQESDSNVSEKTLRADYNVILFDFQSDFFAKALKGLPERFNYIVVKNLNELNQHLKSKKFQIVVFNYDVNPKAVNQLCAQIKQKLPSTKTLIMAKAISPEKAKLHAQTPSGANGYYQFPLDSMKLEKEFDKIYSQVRKAS
jgi:hypothetical protein